MSAAYSSVWLLNLREAMELKKTERKGKEIIKETDHLTYEEPVKAVEL